MATAYELRKLPEGELQAKIKELREKQFQMKFKATTEPVSNPAELGEIRKDIARIHTLLTERKLQGAPRKERLTRAARKVKKARSLAAAGSRKSASAGTATAAATEKKKA